MGLVMTPEMIGLICQPYGPPGWLRKTMLQMKRESEDQTLYEQSQWYQGTLIRIQERALGIRRPDIWE